MGSLISELLQIHEGKFIVRAVIQVGGSTLATGLSASHSIEQAEDQARARAMVVLGIETQPYPTQVHLVPTETDTSHATQTRLSPSVRPADFLPLADSRQPSRAIDWQTAELSALDFDAPEQQQLAWFDPDPYPTAPPAPTGSSRDKTEPSRTPSAKRSPQPEAASRRNEPPPMPQPIDLSEIITQTDIELKRLGWSHAQGRRYLEQTYRKRSRQQLTDGELVEFLDYLKSQSIHAATPP
ncbi:MAG: hypothetical protein WCD18_19950 [Thermosynechococcaceae cyanobacterium]